MYELQKDMYENAMAGRNFDSQFKTIQVMKDNGLSNKDIGFLLSGKFKPEKYSFGKTLNFIEKIGMEGSC